jgi:ADP-ribosylation factor-binding protein GGA
MRRQMTQNHSVSQSTNSYINRCSYFADTFLQINDQINTVLNRYEAFKKGDYVTSSNPIPAELAGRSGSGGLSLIDLDDGAPLDGGSASAASQDELAGLFGPSPNTGMTAPAYSPQIIPSNGFGTMSAAGRSSSTSQPFSAVSPQPFRPGSNSGSSSPVPSQQFGLIMLPGTPTPQGQLQARARSAPNYFNETDDVAKGPVATVGHGMGMGAPLMASISPQPQQPQQMVGSGATTAMTISGSSQPQGQSKDPFADLVGLF